ncbi:MAG: MaoC/PaaZ C-terminal domain-containing protein [Candidatus Binataceae bacterium]
MPLDSSLVGTSSELVSAEVDLAWTMAYAAGLGDAPPCYLDTTLERGIIAHPMFSVAIEWRAMVQIIQVLSEAGFPRSEMMRRVHATDDVIVHRPIRPPERLFTRATLAGIERRTAGAYQITRFDTIDEKGAPVCTTWYGNLYRGVEVAGPDRPPSDAPAILAPSAGAAAAHASFAIPISPVAAHIYGACTRLGNPVNIHTDIATAKKAGLPGTILHGTATLATATSRVIAVEAGGDPARVARIHARFGAMVLMPSEIELRISAREQNTNGKTVFFDVLSADGGRAIRDGFVVLRN